jgi:hypothetical protein
MMATAGLALMAGTASAQSISYDYDRSADFTRLRTYAWVPGTSVKDELNHKRITSAIDAQLAAHGLTRVEAAGNPDVVVAYHADFQTEKEVRAFASGRAWRFGGTGYARVEDVIQGTLIVNIADARTSNVLWRGTARKEIDVNASPEKRDKNVRQAAEKLFKNYPPKKA